MGQKQILSYSVLVYDGPNGYDAPRSGTGPTRAQIQLVFGVGDNGFIRFFDEGIRIPPGRTDVMHLPVQMFHPVVELLRNESPAHLRWAPDGSLPMLGVGYQEPVGEAE
jgi:hypothetical protein